MRLFLSTLILAAVVSLQQSAFAAKPVGKEYVYKTVGDRELRLYVTKPDGWKASDTRPAVVFFHGDQLDGERPSGSCRGSLSCYRRYQQPQAVEGGVSVPVLRPGFDSEGLDGAVDGGWPLKWN